MLRLKVRNRDRSHDLPALMRTIRRAASMAMAAVILCLVALPVYAHDDDDIIQPPSAADVAAAGRITIAVLSLGAAFAVYYGMQRHRVINGDKHPPEWDKKMGRNAIVFALIAAVAVGAVTAALSRPPSNTSQSRPAAASKPS